MITPNELKRNLNKLRLHNESILIDIIFGLVDIEDIIEKEENPIEEIKERIQRIKENGKELVEFIVHPVQKNNLICCKSRAEIIDIRIIKSSNGHKEERIVIQSPIQIGSHYENIEITLTNHML